LVNGQRQIALLNHSLTSLIDRYRKKGLSYSNLFFRHFLILSRSP